MGFAGRMCSLCRCVEAAVYCTDNVVSGEIGIDHQSDGSTPSKALFDEMRGFTQHQPIAPSFGNLECGGLSARYGTEQAVQSPTDCQGAIHCVLNKVLCDGMHTLF